MIVDWRDFCWTPSRQTAIRGLTASKVAGIHLSGDAKPHLFSNERLFLKYSNSSIARGALLSILMLCVGSAISAQTDNTPFPQPTELQHARPLTSQEFLRLLYHWPSHPPHPHPLPAHTPKHR